MTLENGALRNSGTVDVFYNCNPLQYFAYSPMHTYISGQTTSPNGHTPRANIIAL